MVLFCGGRVVLCILADLHRESSRRDSWRHWEHIYEEEHRLLGRHVCSVPTPGLQQNDVLHFVSKRDRVRDWHRHIEARKLFPHFFRSKATARRAQRKIASLVKT